MVITDRKVVLTLKLWADVRYQWARCHSASFHRVLDIWLYHRTVRSKTVHCNLRKCTDVVLEALPGVWSSFPFLFSLHSSFRHSWSSPSTLTMKKPLHCRLMHPRRHLRCCGGVADKQNKNRHHFEKSNERKQQTTEEENNKMATKTTKNISQIDIVRPLLNRSRFTPLKQLSAL